MPTRKLQLLRFHPGRFSVLPHPLRKMKFNISGQKRGIGPMALMPMNLRLEAADGSESEEYRIHGGDIEVRRARRFVEYDSDGQSSSDDDWQTLTAGELSTHVQGNSVVAQWLRHRIGWRRLILACADQQTRATFGIEESVRDRFAA